MSRFPALYMEQYKQNSWVIMTLQQQRPFVLWIPTQNQINVVKQKIPLNVEVQVLSKNELISHQVAVSSYSPGRQ
jgi:hypothetical protein